MKRWILSIAIPFIFATNVVYAEKLATVLEGKIVTKNPAGIQVLLTESDGSILDMSDISSAGVFKLDLTIMDTPSQDEVKKLILQVKNKSGKKNKFSVKTYLNVFDDTVSLKPIIFN